MLYFVLHLQLYKFKILKGCIICHMNCMFNLLSLVKKKSFLYLLKSFSNTIFFYSFMNFDQIIFCFQHIESYIGIVESIKNREFSALKRSKKMAFIKTSIIFLKPG